MRDGTEFLCLDDATALARFVAFVKYRIQQLGGDVFLRGQVSHYPGLVPALFRGASEQAAQRRAAAYRQALSRVQDDLPYGRFHRSNVGALLQHYGAKTPWIDLVDNLYTALWFATHEHRSDHDNRSYYVRAPSEFGWVVLVGTRTIDGESLRCIDLRKHHSSMNVRLHAQHGISAASQDDWEPPTRVDYETYVVARVRVPNDRRFRVNGHLASPRFLFPSPQLDESFNILLSSAANRILAEHERDFRLPDNTLGRIGRIRVSRPNRRR